MKRILFVSLMLIVLVGCFQEEYSFKVHNEDIYFEQTTDAFNIDLLADDVSVYLGETQVDFTDVQMSGEVDLSNVGMYEIILSATNKSKTTEQSLSIIVTDTVNPEFTVFEKELLVYEGEAVQVSSKYFFINLLDGINGLINDRIEHTGDYNLAAAGIYPLQLVGIDHSGNETEYDINLRVTDIIDEKAMYLYKRAIQTVHGETFIFKDDNKKLPIINFEDALNVFTPNFKSHFLWLSGINGTFDSSKSGVEISEVDGNMYASIKEIKDKDAYVKTTLELQYEQDDYRQYIAVSTYKEDNKEVERKFKFIIKKIEGVWLVEEFYMPY